MSLSHFKPVSHPESNELRAAMSDRELEIFGKHLLGLGNISWDALLAELLAEGFEEWTRPKVKTAMFASMWQAPMIGNSMGLFFGVISPWDAMGRSYDPTVEQAVDASVNRAAFELRIGDIMKDHVLSRADAATLLVSRLVKNYAPDVFYP